MEDRYVLAIFAVILVVGAAFLARGIEIPPESVLVPDISIIQDALAIVPSIAMILLAILLIRWSDADRKKRLAYWGIAVVVGVLSVYILAVDPIVSAFITSTVVGGFLAIWTEDPCKKGVWHVVSSPKSIGFVLVLIMLTSYGSSISAELQPAFINKIMEIAISGAGTGTALDVNQIVPPGITPEERAEIIASVERSVPNWDALTPEQQQRIIDQYLQQYLGIKEGIRNALAKSIRNPDREQLRKAVIQQIQSMPIFRTILQNTQYIFAFVGTMLYSIVSLFAEWIAFIVGVLLNLVGKFDVRQKAQD